MLFSESFDIDPPEEDQWFDPILSLDTPLFLDPFLLYADESGVFEGSHAEIIEFFNSVYKVVARTKGDSSSHLWNKVVAQLYLPEVEELCLGYASSGTSGSGSGGGIANTIANALWEAVRAGIEELSHFEEIAILREGVGPDRISDATANIIRWRLAKYTRNVCQENGVPLKSYRYRRGRFEPSAARWIPERFDLPTNPYNGKPVLLVPKEYLRELPTITADDFWNYCYTNENELLRAEYSDDVARNVDKATIVHFARRHPDARGRYIDFVEDKSPEAYDFVGDKRGVTAWYEGSKSYCLANPRTLGFQTPRSFSDFVESLVEEFKHFVEQNAGWRLLWNDNGTSRREDAAQRLFYGIVKHYCASNDIDISPETDVGRGPVDFKVSRGYQYRAHLEVKLARNTKFWRGLEKQLPTYQKAELVQLGFFIVVVYTESDHQRIAGIRSRITKLRSSSGLNIRPVIVDATQAPPSASKL